MSLSSDVAALEPLFSNLVLDEKFEIQFAVGLDVDEKSVPLLPGENQSRHVYQTNCHVVDLVRAGNRAEGLGSFLQTLALMEKHEVTLEDDIFYSFLYAICHLWPITDLSVYPSLSEVFVSDKKLITLFREFQHYFTTVQYTSFLVEKEFASALKLYCLYADYLFSLNQVPMAKQAFLVLLQLYQSPQISPVASASVAHCFQKLGSIFKKYGNIQEARCYLEKAYALQKRSIAKSITADLLGGVLTSLGHFQKARELLNEALQIKKQHYPEHHPFYLQSLNALGRCFCAQGAFLEAMNCFALVLKSEPVNIQALNGVADVLKEKGLFGRASQQYGQVCKAILAQKGVLFFEDAMLLMQCQGLSLRLEGKYHEAVTPFINLNAFRPSDPMVGFNMAESLQSMGSFDKAFSCYEVATQIHQVMFGKNHYFEAAYLEQMGLCLAYTGKHSAAFDLLNRALDMRKAYLGPESLAVAHSYDCLGKYYDVVQNGDLAQAAYKMAYAIRRARNDVSQQLLDLSTTFIDNHHNRALENGAVAHKLSSEQFYELVTFAYSFIKELKIADAVLESNPTGFVRLRLPVPDAYQDHIETLRINFWAPDLKLCIVEVPHNHPRYFESLILKGGYTHVAYRPHENSSEITHVVNRIFKSGSEGRNITPCAARSLCCLGPQSFMQGAHIAFPLSVIHQVTQTIPGTMSINCVMKDSLNCDYYDVFMPVNGPQDPQVERIELLDENKEVIISQILKNLEVWLRECSDRVNFGCHDKVTF